VIGVLRFVGILNAATWVGTALFFTFSVGPGFFSQKMLQLLGRPYAGMAAQVILERYFRMQYVCVAIALAHLAIEWLYTGRPLHKVRLALLMGLLGLVLSGGVWLQPKLTRLHLEIYSTRSVPAQVEKARRAFSLWHGLSQTLNVLSLGGLLVYLWQVTHTTDAPRFISPTKFTLESFRG
jgi:hypothetical protein